MCESTGLVTSVYKDAGRFIKKGEPIYEYIDYSTNNNVVQWTSPVTGLISEVNVYPGSEIYLGKPALTIKAFVEEYEHKSQLADNNENNINKTYKDYEKQIYCFAPVETLSKFTIGQEVEIVPTTADKYTHGHMLGEITYVSAFVSSEEDIRSIIGVNTSIDIINQLGNVGVFKVKLKKDENTVSGFYWSNPNGANVPIYEGEVVNASVVMSKVHPASFVFPWI